MISGNFTPDRLRYAFYDSFNIKIREWRKSAKNTSKVSTKWYTISKKLGTYQQKVTLKVTAKKGFQVYYTTNGTFRLKKKISSSNNTCVIYSNDDGINAASKSSTTYVYADESEEKYTKTTVSSSDNVLNVYSGYVNVMIADNETHTITLPVKNGNNNTITYSADRDDNFPLNTA